MDAQKGQVPIKVLDVSPTGSVSPETSGDDDDDDGVITDDGPDPGHKGRGGIIGTIIGIVIILIILCILFC